MQMIITIGQVLTDEYNFITASMLASEHTLNLLFLTFMQLKYLKKNKNLHNNLNFKKQAQ